MVLAVDVGAVASGATAWRVLDTIDEAALARLRAARAAARELAWLQLADTRGRLPATTVLDRVLPGFVLDIDATIYRHRLDSRPQQRRRSA